MAKQRAVILAQLVDLQELALVVMLQAEEQ